MHAATRTRPIGIALALTLGIPLSASVLPASAPSPQQQQQQQQPDTRSGAPSGDAPGSGGNGNRWFADAGGWSVELGGGWRTVTAPAAIGELRAAFQSWPIGPRLVDSYAHEVQQQLTVLLAPKDGAPLFVAVTTLPAPPPNGERLRDPSFAEMHRSAMQQRLSALPGVSSVRSDEPRIVQVDQVPSLWLGGTVLGEGEHTLALWDTRLVPGTATFRIDAFAAPEAGEAWVGRVDALLSTFDGAQDTSVQPHWLAIALPIAGVVVVAGILLLVARSFRNSRPMRHLPPIQEPGERTASGEAPPGASPRPQPRR